MKRALYGGYAVAAYVVGMAALVYLMGFVIGAPLPKNIDGGVSAALPRSPATNVAILIAFLVPHSVMARPRFKAWWTRFVPAALERTTYVLWSGISTLLLLWAWQPMPSTLWEIEHPVARYVIYAAYAFGWGTIVLATFNIDHFSFFGLRQVWDAIRARTPAKVPFTARWLYGLVRHPISLGWIIVFWSTPHMTWGHLLFAAAMTAYIAIVTPIEEADLVADIGEDYVRYRERVRGFVPLRRGGLEPVAGEARVSSSRSDDAKEKVWS